MGLGLHRNHLQAVAEAKLEDAETLLLLGRNSNAYYLAGYAVEIGLKACIALQMTAETIPDKDFIKKILSHEFKVLVGLAGLSTNLKATQDGNPDFEANWAVVSEWALDSRYETADPTSAQTLVSAITDQASGVLQWIRTHW